jgi:hypothetical protein
MSDDIDDGLEDLWERIREVQKVKDIDPNLLPGAPGFRMDELIAELTYMSDEAEAALRKQAEAEIDVEELLEMTERPPEAAVTVRQAARALGLTREHVYARIRAGSIRAIDGPGAKGQGTVRLVPIAEIERLVVEQGPRRHGEVKPDAPDSRPILQLERVTQRLESTRAVLSDAVEAMAEPESGSWWGRRKRERERLARIEAALRAAHAAADAGAPGDVSG